VRDLISVDYAFTRLFAFKLFEIQLFRDKKRKSRSSSSHKVVDEHEAVFSEKYLTSAFAGFKSLKRHFEHRQPLEEICLDRAGSTWCG
jgi:hypothetical protein